MATKDFRASQIRTSQIIGSGSQSGKPTILVVSASDSSGFNGEALDNSTLLANVGSDVFLFVTGSKNTRTAVTLFGGDVVISGTMYADKQVVEVDLATTGSLSISGSLHVSQSATIYEGLVVNESGEGGPENDFRVESDGEDEALFLDASANTLYINKGETAFTTIIGSTNDEAVRVGSAGVVFNEDGHATNDFRVESDTEPHALFVDAGANELHINSGETAFLTTIHNVDGEAVSITATEVVINDDGVSTIDLRAETNNKTHALFIDAGSDQVLILSGGGVESPDESSATDLAFFVSGTIGSKDSTNKGTAVFGGDVVVSGTHYGLDDIVISSNATISGSNLDIANKVRHIGDTSTNISFDTEVIEFSLAGDGGLMLDRSPSGAWPHTTFNLEGNNFDFGVVGNDGHVKLYLSGNSATTQNLYLSASQVLIGADYRTAFAPPVGDDTVFFVSGVIGSKDSTNKGTAVFGGDVVVSGTLFANDGGGSLGLQSTSTGTALKLRHDSDDFVDFSVNSSGMLTIAAAGSAAGGGVKIDVENSITLDVNEAEEGIYYADGGTNLLQIYNDGSQNVKFQISQGSKTLEMEESDGTSLLKAGNDQILILSGGGATSYNEAAGSDVNFYVSGTAGSMGSSTKGTAVFGGDVVVSGTLSGGSPLVVAGGLQITGTLDVSSSSAIKSTSLSGSLTKLIDGTSYLIAGANVTIATGSSGAVTIASTGGGAADAVGWTGPANSVIATTGSLNIGTTSATPGDSDIFLSANGAAVFNEQGASVDFRVESNTKSNALLVDGSTDQVLILSGGASSSTNEAVGADVNFYVSGSTSSASTSARGTSLFGGDLVASGTILPGTDLGSNLGAPTRRFGNIYTGDLHLRNERGNWTIVEEADYLCVVNNLTGKKFKMALIPLDDD
jgi:hypothetical protein